MHDDDAYVYIQYRYIANACIGSLASLLEEANLNIRFLHGPEIVRVEASILRKYGVIADNV
jgi:hypothetical protein